MRSVIFVGKILARNDSLIKTSSSTSFHSSSYPIPLLLEKVFQEVSERPLKHKNGHLVMNKNENKRIQQRKRQTKQPKCLFQ